MDVSVVGVVGAGFMGSGIVESSSSAGKRVLLFEPSEAPLEYSRRMLAAALERAVREGSGSLARTPMPRPPA